MKEIQKKNKNIFNLKMENKKRQTRMTNINKGTTINMLDKKVYKNFLDNLKKTKNDLKKKFDVRVRKNNTTIF